MTVEKVSRISQIKEQIDTDHIFYGDDPYNSFYIVFENDTPILGLAYYDFGLQPCVFEDIEKGVAYIGFGQKILIIDLRNDKIHEKEVPSVFFDILTVKDSNIFICETDIYAFRDGKEIFSMNFDRIICDVTIVDNNSICILFDSGEDIMVPIVFSDP